MSAYWPSLAGVVVLAAVHLAAGALHQGALKRPAWLSAASGVAIAYVFLGLLPDLAESQARWLEATPHRPLPWLTHQVYLAALLGLLAYFALARAGAGSESRSRFWLELGSFAVYNLVIGILGSQLRSWPAIVIAVIAYGAHMLVNDYGLHRRYTQLYAGPGRWTLAIAIVFGWVLGALLPVSQLVAVLLIGVVAGGILLNSLREEAPEPGSDKLIPFVSGALVYAALLVALSYAVETERHVVGHHLLEIAHGALADLK